MDANSKNSNYEGRLIMINIVCKKCGWKLPFTAKANKANICGRRAEDVQCPKCGKILIQKGGKTNKWY